MEFFKQHTKIDFMGLRRYTAFISVLLCGACVVSLFVKGLNFALDFTGGTQIEVRFEQPADVDAIRHTLETHGFKNAKVQTVDALTDVMIRVHAEDESTGGEGEVALGAKIKDLFTQNQQNVEIKRIEFVGSEVGNELVEQGGLALLIAILATMLYIALRFEWRLAVSAALALLHDPILILGIFSVTQIEFDLPTLAALLAMIGYSLNDTIVVFDRLREVFRAGRKLTAIQAMNQSINSTLSRTVMTSGSTLLVVIALLVHGGSALFGFSLALCIGIIVGTYSSIYVAGALAVSLKLERKHLLIQGVKTEAEGRP